ncbi:MAG: GAF domain-containing sensor histidine kinase [Anaerolineales bacterium]|nr:GAF domain-containing sensor histidine kinase [Anaerolineales bacterium]
MSGQPPRWYPSTNFHSSQKGGRSLVEAELEASVAWLIGLRWLAGIGVLIVTWSVNAIFKFRISPFPLYLIGAVILLYNIIFYFTEQRFKQTSISVKGYIGLAQWQVGLDWLAMVLLFHYSGGIESPAILFFIFHIIIASIFFKPRTAYGFTIAAILLVWGTVWLEFWGILPHRPIVGFIQEPLYKNIWYVLATLFFFGATGLISAFLATSINQRLRQREEEVMELTESLQRATDRLQALNDGARTISSTLDLTQVLNRLVKNTAEAIQVDACSIRMVDATGQILEEMAAYGLSQVYLNKGPLELEKNPLAREVLSGKVVNIPDTTQTNLLQYPSEAAEEGISSMLSAPLIGKNGPMGILRAYSRETDRFSDDDGTFLSAIAAQGSIAIENALAYQAIETLDATKSQFVRMVTHELRSPVSVMRSLLRTITAGYAGGLNDQQSDILNRAQKRVDALQGLIDDLLDLAAGKVELKSHGEAEAINLEDVIVQVMERFEVIAKEKEITFEWYNQSPGVLISTKATKEGLDRIFNNLVSNAIKYTLPKGKVIVSLERIGDEAYTIIEDTGIGISMEAQSQLFQEFYRAPNAKEIEREGTGLGLAIVKDIVTHIGGRISVKSKLGKGSQFTVILPVLKE